MDDKQELSTKYMPVHEEEHIVHEIEEGEVIVPTKISSKFYCGYILRIVYSILYTFMIWYFYTKMDNTRSRFELFSTEWL